MGGSLTCGNRWNIYLLARFGGITAEPTYPIHSNPLFVAVDQPGAPPLSLPSSFTSSLFSSWFLSSWCYWIRAHLLLVFS
jgi:hypothetical protein